jgi:non-specific serine/threonine protein kinase/serine/threonine-protein kinase
MSTRWERINAVFDRAVETPAHDRAAYLDEACAGDADLRGEVERLLEAHARASGFFEVPLDRAFERIAEGASRGLEGRRVGAWRILKEVGRGGMGTVCLGERADRQFEQRVAIKLIHPGLDADWVLRRFQTERRILAGLDHPHIGRLYDGGTTEDGAPYFVMEFIEGAPMDRFCDERRLNVTQRLVLFRQVCSAVAFAHQNLVIHRDLKPSNVIVAGDGTAKLLDFGIATILHDPESGGEARTVTGQPLMTPEYASPEQIHGLRATTASDIYSLGVMLYELLSGRPPYRFATRSLPEVARVVSEVKPERPSTAVASPRWAEAEGARATPSAEAVSAVREGSVDRLRRRLEGDLDTIVLKAMHADPHQRYATAEQFSEDIRRHLVGLPVVARPDTIVYRTRKFVRRNRVAVGAGVLVALALVGGVATTAWQARRAREAQGRAERRFADLRKLAHAVLFDYHDAIQSLAGSTPVRERLVTDGLEYLDGLAREAGDDVSLQRELADAYVRMGDVQGGISAANLGNTAGALESYGKAQAIYESIVSADSADTDGQRRLARILVKRARLVWQNGGAQEALGIVQRARQMMEPLVQEAPSDGALRMQLVVALDTGGMLLQATGDNDAAMNAHKRQLEHVEALVSADAADPEFRRALYIANMRMSSVASAKGDHASALEYSNASLRQSSALAAEFPMNAGYQRAVGSARFDVGRLLATLGRTREALEQYEKTLALADSLVAKDPKNEQYQSDRGAALLTVGDMRARLDDIAGAIRCYRASLAIRSAQSESDPSNVVKRSGVIQSHGKLAKALGLNGEYAAANAHYDAAIALLEATVPESTNVGLHTMKAGQYAELGAAQAIAAADSRRAGAAAAESWRRALDMYQRGASIWTDLRERGLIAASDTAQIDSLSHEIARCRSALGR